MSPNEIIRQDTAQATAQQARHAVDERVHVSLHRLMRLQHAAAGFSFGQPRGSTDWQPTERHPMTPDPYSLDNLRDIVEPASIPWWPPAPGVWLLLALVAGA